jgi:hypothetical protein
MATQRFDNAHGLFVLATDDNTAAVTFEPSVRSLQVHSVSARPDLPATRMHCHVLGGGCYTDGSSSAGSKLHEQWEASGFDNQVIWNELHTWFASRFDA